MKRVLLIFSYCLLFTLGYSQNWKLKRFEVFAGVSVFQYFGDIGGSADKSTLFGLKDISLKSNRPGLTFGGTFRVYERFYIHGGNSFGFFAQTDKGSRNSTRNFAFTTIINEISIQGQFFFIKEKQNYYYNIMGMRGGLRNFNRPLSFYAFAGAGSIFFKVNPKSSLDGSPRLTNDQSISYVFPVGLGLKFAYTPKLAFAMEIGGRFALSDKLDGFTSVNSKYNDLYYIMNFKASYRLTRGKGLFQMFPKRMRF